MSGGPTLTGEHWRKVIRTNIRLKPEDWCTYRGICYKDADVGNGNIEFCLLCRWRSHLDIPKILETERERRK